MFLSKQNPKKPINFGDLGTTEPVSRVFGFDRGHCLDRYYMEQFLEKYSACIHGRVLEAEDSTYTNRFGGENVGIREVLHVAEGAKNATVVGDLTDQQFPMDDNSLDCIILTQTLHVIFDIHTAVRTLHRILKPGGHLLLTAPGISQVSRYDMDRWGDCWRFTDFSLRKLMETVFPSDGVEISTYGNILISQSFLQGMVVEDVPVEALDVVDPDYQLLITACARKEG